MVSPEKPPINIVQAGDAQITESDFQAVRDVLNKLDGDYPGTGFVLDLMLSGIEVRPPFLQPAKMESNGLLVPHPGRTDVVFHLPKVKVRVRQGTDINAVLDVSLVSLGASGLDDSGDLSAAEMIRMEPAYAFIGSGRVVGFGFRSAYLDLSDGYTPPEVLDKFGFDESWTGLYLPEIRIFFAPNGAEDFAVNGGVDDLLIGLGESQGVSGDFGLAVINQGSGELKLGARFFDDQGRAIGLTRLTDSTAEVRVPASSRMVIDVVGGRAPYTTNAEFDGSEHAGVIHALSTTAAGKTVVVKASDTSTPPKSLKLTISVMLREAQLVEQPSNVVSDTPATITTSKITLGGAFSRTARPDDSPAPHEIDLVTVLAERMASQPNLKVIVVTPRESDLIPAPFARRAYAQRLEAYTLLKNVDPNRVVIFHPRGFPGRHARMRSTTVIVDDVWTMTGATHFRWRGMTFDGSAAIASFDRDIVRGYSRKVQDQRIALMAAKLELAAIDADGLPEPSYQRLYRPASAFTLIRDLLAQGGLGMISALWHGPTDDSVLPQTDNVTDPDGSSGAPAELTLASFLGEA